MGDRISQLRHVPDDAHDAHASPRATASPNPTKHATNSEPWITTAQPPNEAKYTVFISHAGEDKATIAIPLCEKLMARGITVFVDEADMQPGTDAVASVIYAMETAKVAVIVLSPEFIAKKWTMKELFWFLRRRQTIENDQEGPIVIPFFYRLSLAELYGEPRLDRRSEDGELLYRKSRFFERQARGEPEADISNIKNALHILHGIMGMRNDMDASNESSYIMSKKRDILLCELCDNVEQAVAKNLRLEAVGIEERQGQAHVDRFEKFFPGPESRLRFVLDLSNPNTTEGRVKQHLLEKKVPSVSPRVSVSPNPKRHATNSKPWITTAQPPNEPKYTVFISHAGEDKATIAIPLCGKLKARGITVFDDQADIPPGSDAAVAIIEAMETAKVAVVVLSPEFIARTWPMRELFCFLRRRLEAIENDQEGPIVIPFFYRLSLAELYGEPRLDRRSEDGELLYRKSRFFERQARGEPEADISNIKNALHILHGIMGMRNDMDASNESSYIMSKKRDILLCELCDNVGEAVSKLGQFRKQTTGSPRVVSICGVGGVGKSTVLRALSRDREVREHFSDGVHIITLGKDSSTGTLFRQICRVLRDSGAKGTYSSLRVQNNVHNALTFFESWFDGKRCAFLIDDVWPDEVLLSLLSRLLKISSGPSGNGVLITTREREIAKLAPPEKSVRLEPREARGLIARKILFLHADQQETEHRSTPVEDSIRRILDICAGLPVALAAAGRNVLKISLKLPRPGNEEAAWKQYLTQLEMSQRNLFVTSISNLDDQREMRHLFATSISNLDKQRRKETLGYAPPLSFEQMYQRLCVVPKQKAVPRSMLKHLWQTTDEHADMILETFVEWDLASRKVMRAGEEHMWHLILHDLLHDFAVEGAKRGNDTKKAHECLLNGYRSDGETSSELRGTSIWWSPELRPDGYIHENLCRHLLEAGHTTELVELLMSPQWAKRQLEVNDLQTLQADFALGIKALREGRRQEPEF